NGAYLPMDPAYPKQRLAFMLEDSQPKVVVTQQSLINALPEHTTTVVCIDSQWAGIANCCDQNLDGTAGERNLAYVIYTSGSTGRPKAVSIEHCSAVALIEWAKEVFGKPELNGVLASTSICFDLSVFEIFVPLS